MKTENVRIQLKKNENIFKIVWCIGNANINIQWIFQISTVIRFLITTNKEISTWEIEWISNIVRLWTLNAYKNLIWLSGRDFFIDKGRQTYE